MKDISQLTLSKLLVPDEQDQTVLEVTSIIERLPFSNQSSAWVWILNWGWSYVVRWPVWVWPDTGLSRHSGAPAGGGRTSPDCGRGWPVCACRLERARALRSQPSPHSDRSRRDWVTHLEQVCDLQLRTSSWLRSARPPSGTSDCWPGRCCQLLHHRM